MIETIEKPVSETAMQDASESDALQVQDSKRPRITDFKCLSLFCEPVGTLRLTVKNGNSEWGDYSYPVVKLYQAVPLSMPGRYIVLQDGKGEEIIMADSIRDFAPEVQAVVQDELNRRYLTARITAIPNIRQDFGITYWDVLTDRGKRDFVVQSMSESCTWLSDTHILVTDVDGNRFEIVDRNALDPHSQTQLQQVM